MRTSLAVQPHLYIGDSIGRPLDYGMVYFGQVDKDPEFYPIDVFYDSEMTIAAAQPVRTKGGFLNAAGDMVEIYAAPLEYSVKVLDRHGVQVFYKPRMTKASVADNITVQLPLVGAVKRTQADKSADIVSLKDFYNPLADLGDYTAALQRALDSGAEVIDGGGESYTLNSKVTASRGNVLLSNMFLNQAEFLHQGATLLSFEGSQEPIARPFTILSAHSVQLMDATGLDAGDIVYLESSAKWNTIEQTVALGELLRIEEINHSTKIVTFSSGTISYYPASDTPSLRKINMLDNITLDNVWINGIDESKRITSYDSRGSLSCGLDFKMCSNVYLYNFNSKHFDNRHLMFSKVYRGRIFGGSFYDTGDLDGVDYGLVIANGCFDIIADSFSAERTKCAVSVGGSAGVNKAITISKCRSIAPKGTSFNSHPACADIEFIGCRTEGYVGGEVGQDGISSQSANLKVTDCTFNNIMRTGLSYSPYVKSGMYRGDIGLSYSGNKVNENDLNPNPSSSGVFVSSTTGSSKINYVKLDNNIINGFNYSALVQASGTRVDIDGVSISGTTVVKAAKNRSVRLLASNGSINKVIMHSNNLKADTDNQVVDLTAGAGSKIKDINISGNIIEGVGAKRAIGINLYGCENGKVQDNTFINCLTRVRQVSSSNIQARTEDVYEGTYTSITVAANSETAIIVDAMGVTLGALIEVSLDKSLGSCRVYGYASAPDRVTIAAFNPSSSPQSIGAGKYRLFVKTYA